MLKTNKLSYLLVSVVMASSLNSAPVIAQDTYLKRITSPTNQFKQASLEDMILSTANNYLSIEESTTNENEKINLLNSADNEFNHLLHLNNKNEKALAGKGEVYARFGLYDKAILYFEAAKKLDQSNSVYDLSIAFCLSMQSKFEEAILTYKSLIKANPNDAKAYRSMARTYILMNDFDNAEKSYQRAISLNPGYYSALNDYGFFLLDKKNDPKRALEQFEMAIKLNPIEKSAYSGKEEALKKMSSSGFQ